MIREPLDVNQQEWFARSSHTGCLDETVDLHMFLKMIGPAV
jgi:hypothetical protein